MDFRDIYSTRTATTNKSNCLFYNEPRGGTTIVHFVVMSAVAQARAFQVRLEVRLISR